MLVVALLAGGSSAAVATAIEIAGRWRVVRRVSTPPAAAPVIATISLLIVSALIEELAFRVGAIALLDGIAGDTGAIVVSAAAFAVIHALRGSGWEERSASVVTGFAFGVVLGRLWLDTRSLPALVAFHASFNVVGGLVLGWGALDPVSRRSSTPVWPLALAPGRRARRGALGVALFALPELVALAAAAAVLGSAA